MEKLRWGILGPGNIANKFAADFQHSDLGTLVAVASRTRSHAQEFASRFNIERSYGSYADLYNDPDVDVVYVATPHTFHYEQSVAAMKAGKAVLCEKPLTHSFQQTNELITTAQSCSRFLMEGMWTWFLPAVQKAKQWYELDRIGEIRNIQASFGFPFEYDPKHRCFNPNLGGGVLLDMGIYTLALVHFFSGEDPEVLHAVARKAPTGVDSDVSILMKHSTFTSVLQCSFDVKMPNWAYIIGEKGTIAMPDFWHASECFLYEGEKLIDHYQDHRPGFGFNFEIDAVSNDVLNGKKESDIVDHASSLRLAKAMDDVLHLV